MHFSGHGEIFCISASCAAGKELVMDMDLSKSLFRIATTELLPRKELPPLLPALLCCACCVSLLRWLERELQVCCVNPSFRNSLCKQRTRPHCPSPPLRYVKIVPLFRRRTLLHFPKGAKNHHQTDQTFRRTHATTATQRCGQHRHLPTQ